MRKSLGNVIRWFRPVEADSDVTASTLRKQSAEKENLTHAWVIA
jgi:hypothetical protein